MSEVSRPHRTRSGRLLGEMIYTFDDKGEFVSQRYEQADAVTPVDEGKRMGSSMFDLDTEAVRARYENAMGKRATLDDADAALADIPVLLSEISRLEARLREATTRASEYEELEARLCPEDFGFEEYIKSLQKRSSLTPPSVSPVSSGEAKE